MSRFLEVFDVQSSVGVLALAFSVLLLLILIVSFRSRAVVFCQYLFAMTGIRLKPADVKRAFIERGQSGVRDLFLELIIQQDLQKGPILIPEPFGAPTVDEPEPPRAA